MKIFISSLLLALSCITTFSQTPWTLGNCIDYAHTHNLTIKARELQAENAKGDYAQSRMNVLPSLNVSASRRYNFGWQVDPFTNDFISEQTLSDNYGISSDMNLFTGLRILNYIRSSEYTMLARIQDVEKEKVNISIQIATAYLQILFNEELLKVAQEQQQVTSMQVERTKSLVEAGNAAMGDLLEIKAQLAAENLNITQTHNLRNLAYLNLAQLLDFESIDSFKIYIPDTLAPDVDLLIPSSYSVYSDARTILPHVKSAEYDVLSAERNFQAAKGRLLPTISLGANLNTGYSDNRTQLNQNDIQQRTIGYLQSDPSQLVASNYFGSQPYPYMDQLTENAASTVYLSLSIPIFNRWENKNAISRARINTELSKNTLRYTEQQLLKEIQQAYNDAVSAREKYISSSQAVQSYEESFKYTDQKFDVGIVNNVEYTIAKNNLIKAQSEWVKAKYEYYFSLKILDFYRGIPLNLL